ncbi:Tetratricopeptide repeat protein 29 [Myotis brandtii]|uniref:Tetratricopeptide repeat protein 29 n=1 Tax=Myotis brandtii TaxID=109478 RepID=S7MR90_MYOBR|nr:Tetratricopeptide repeat protein 29 [Myotis brandtii]
MSRPKLTALAREKLPCSPRTTPRSELIKEKDDIDHYLEVKLKGLSKEEVAAYRNTYKKNICVDMLRDGYHKSFTELFTLMEKWEALREAARVRSVFWLQKPLEEQPDKLDHFYYYLTRAEVAERKKYFEDVYDNLYALACYFNNSEDKWVRNHFYKRCFEIAELIKIDGGKKEAEAHGHMGLLFEEEGKLLEAAEHYEAFHQLTQGRKWRDETGRFLNLLACGSLLRTYRLLSDKMLENKDYTQAIRILIKASEIAKEVSEGGSDAGTEETVDSFSLKTAGYRYPKHADSPACGQLASCAVQFIPSFRRMLEGSLLHWRRFRYLETEAQGNQVTYPRSFPELMAEEKLELMSSNTLSVAHVAFTLCAGRLLMFLRNGVLVLDLDELLYCTYQGPQHGFHDLSTYSEISTELEDDLSLGRAYEAIARVLQSQGEMVEAITYLKKFVKLARNNFQKLDVVKASTMLGDIYNEKGHYNKASEYFQQAFDTTAELTNVPLMDETKVHYGIAKAHQMMLTISNYIEAADLSSLNTLLSWKETRSNISPDPVIGDQVGKVRSI